jgi:DNA-binding transcriptional LysR family regulator
VVGAGSFSGAAREMQVSQTLVTKQIQELESWLGARLLNRTTRRLSLTEVGTAFYERAARILEAVDQRHRTQAVRLPDVRRDR